MAKKKTKQPAKLQEALVLFKYILSLFGCKDLAALSGDLKDAQDWMKFATERFYKENETRGSRTEPPFKDVNEFLAEVARIMKQSHLEDRVSERTASRIRSMAVPLVIRAPDHRLLPDNMKSG